MGELLARVHDQNDFDAPSWDELCAAAEQVLGCARSRDITLGTAESCTGGLICAALTAVAGSSDVVMGSVVSYACSVKESALGVRAQTLASHGAVSSECACEMAQGATRALGSSVSVAVTGIAGPGGAVPGKPVGCVWLAVSDGAYSFSERHLFSGDRGAVRAKTALAALSMLVDFMEGGIRS